MLGLVALGGLALLTQWYLGRETELISVFWLLLAGFIALMRCVIWCCFRFPLTSWFFVVFLGAMVGRRRRW